MLAEVRTKMTGFKKTKWHQHYTNSYYVNDIYRKGNKFYAWVVRGTYNEMICIADSVKEFKIVVKDTRTTIFKYY